MVNATAAMLQTVAPMEIVRKFGGPGRKKNVLLGDAYSPIPETWTLYTC